MKKKIKKINKYKKLFNQVSSDILKNIDNTKNTFNVFSDKFKFNFSINELSKFKKYRNIVLIGMGGSILCSEAIKGFLIHKIKKKVFFFNDINPELIYQTKKKINFKKTLFIIISKSGSTIETLSNFLSLKIIKKNSKNIILISEKKNNFLFNLSKKLNLFYIEHKDYIGGRYSVLSEVGIVPAYLMGLDIIKLRSKLKQFLRGSKKNLLRSDVVNLASIISEKKYSNLVLLNYEPRFEKFLYWVQQLIAESLGKNKMGLFPIISNAPKDHHSLLQLYLDGPKNNLFYIFYNNEKIKTKIKTKNFSKKEIFFKNKSLSEIKIAQKNALIRVFKHKKIPFKEFEIKKFNEKTLSSLFSYFMLKTAIAGKLLNMNPFNQPQVEQVKKETKKILS